MLIKRIAAAGIFAVLAVALVPASAWAVSGDHIAPDGSYSGTSHCIDGYDVRVDFDVVEGLVANVAISPAFAANNEPYFTNGRNNTKLAGVTASPNAVDAVDTVSGATHTSMALKEAVSGALFDADPGVTVQMSDPVRDDASGMYSVTLEAYATNAGATEAKGTGTELRFAVGDGLDLTNAQVDAVVSSNVNGAWTQVGDELAVTRPGANACVVSGFDYPAHSVASGSAASSASPQKVVVKISGIDPRYTNAAQTGVAFNAPACGLYKDANATSRIAGPSKLHTIDIPAYIPLPTGLELAYTGQAQQGVRYSSAECIAEYTTSATEIGEYFASVKLRPGRGYRWADGTWGAKFVSWSIVTKAPEVTPATPDVPAPTNGNDPANASGNAQPAASQQQTGQPQAKAVVINAKTVTAKAVKAALAAASNQGATTVTLGAKVKRIAKGAFKGTKVKTLIVKTKKLAKKSVKGCLKGSKVKSIQVKIGNKKVAKKYKKIFTKKVAGKKAKVK